MGIYYMAKRYKIITVYNFIMDNKDVKYLKTDDNKIINETSILWVKKMDDCLDVCVKSTGCGNHGDTHKICLLNNQESYNKLNKHFLNKTS